MAKTREGVDTNDEESTRVRALEATVAKQKSMIDKQKKKLATNAVVSSATRPKIQRSDIKIVKSKKRDEMTKDERTWSNVIYDEVKDTLWPGLKFCNTELRCVNATYRVLNRMKPTEFQNLVGNELDEGKAQWVANNADHVRGGLNDVRNYAQSNIRAEIVGRRVAKKWVPSIEQILDCATREQYLDQTEEGKKLFAYYWDVLLMKVVGKKHWDKPFRHYKTIGEAVHADRQDDAACITPGTEAFLYLLFENCEQKWIHLANEKILGKKHDPTHVNCKVPFVDKDAGQQKWGGWSALGRKRYVELKGKIKDARAQDHVKVLEENCLERLRIEHDIVKRDEGRKCKGKKRKIEEVEEEDDEFG
jgi:hypothetical protein